jgi:hypothetical protein
MKGDTMKQLIRIMGHNGVVYEEQMTEGQLMQFLQQREARKSLGVACDEWEITIMAAVLSLYEHQPKEMASDSSAHLCGEVCCLSLSTA